MRGRRQPERNVRVDRPDRCQAVGAGEHPLQRASGLPVGLVVPRSGRSGHARRVHQPGLRTWTSTQSDSQLTMLTISCPSTSLCVARRPARELLVSTNPTRRCRRLGGDARPERPQPAGIHTDLDARRHPRDRQPALTDAQVDPPSAWYDRSPSNQEGGNMPGPLQVMVGPLGARYLWG